jgi:Flp pilus assembly secretin CpaC
LLRAAANIRRAAVVDSRVSDVIQVGPRDVVLLGKGVGKTDVTIWIGDQTPQPVVVLVRVLRD